MDYKNQQLWMTLRTLNRQSFNTTCIKHRHFDVHLSTAKNCGTHWIKFLLSHVFSKVYDLPAPEDIRDERLIGHPKTPPQYPHIKQVAVTHSHPHYLMRIPALHKALGLPLYAFMVRDIRHLVVSLYEKWNGDFEQFYGKQLSFSEYLRGVPEGNVMGDLWDIIMYYNAWGRARDAAPERVLMMRYEDWKADTEKELTKLCTYIGLTDIDPKIIQYAVEKSSKQEMSQKLSESVIHHDKIVNVTERDPLQWYSKEDMEFLIGALDACLEYDFGYEFLKGEV